MGAYDLTATFNAIDNISGVTGNIVNSVGSMVESSISALKNLSANGIDPTTLAMGAMTAGIQLAGQALQAGIDQAIEVETAMRGISARTGETGENLSNMEQAAKDLFNSGVVSNFQDAADAVEATYTQIHNLDMAGNDMQKFQLEAQGLSKAWGVSATDIINSVGDMQDRFSDLAESPLQTMNMLTQATQNAHIPLKDMLGTMDKFGPVMSEAGLNGQQALELISQAGDNGITNFSALSKTIDTFHQRVVKPPPGFQNALQELGLKKVAYDLRNNKTDMATALDQIYSKFEKMPDGPKKTQLAIDLFGKSIDKLDPGKLAGFKDAFDETRDAAQEVTDKMNNNFGTALQGFGNKVKTFLGDAVETAYQRIKAIDWKKIGDSISAIVDWFKGKWQEWFGSGGKLASMISDALSAASGFAGKALDTVGKAIGNVVDGFSATWNDWFGATGKLSTAVSQAIDGVGKAIEGGKGIVSTAISGVTSAVSTAWDSVFSAGSSLVTGVNSAFAKVKSAIDVAVTTVSLAISGVTGAVKDAWDSVFGPGGLAKDVGDAINSAIATANGLVGAIGAAFAAIGNAAIAGLKPILDTIGSIMQAIAGLGGAINNLGLGGLGGVPHINLPGHATGGTVRGMTMVGEHGPELLYNSGQGLARIFTNTQTQAMTGSMGNGGGMNINISAGTIVGSGGMKEFSRMIYKELQGEDYRRGKRQ